MPVYEYETRDEECTMCEGRLRFVQPVSAEPLTQCPTCGLAIVRVVSAARHKIARTSAEEGGFTTYRKTREGVWEKTAGAEGADALVGTDEDKAAVKAEEKRVYDVDKPV